MSKKYIIGSLIITLLLGLGFYVPAYAAKNNQNGNPNNRRGEERRNEVRQGPGIFGSVTAINGTTLTVLSKDFPGGRMGDINNNSNSANFESKTYTVDASKATVIKAGAEASLSLITVGENVMIDGTINGTNITASVVRFGLLLNGNGANGIGPSFEGNGQPVIGGTVTAINGNSITITNKGGVQYTIDATNAKVIKDGVDSKVSSILVGEALMAQGTINGNSVIATSIIDHSKVLDQNSNTTNTKNTAKKGFFRSIGGFFGRIFGI